MRHTPLNRRLPIAVGSVFALAVACNLQVAAPEAAPSATRAETPTVPAPTSTPTAPPTPEPTPTETRPHIVEQTLYEGEKTYTCDPGGCWRDDGGVSAPAGLFYPDIEMDNEEVRALLDSIGLPAEPAAEDAERWSRIRAVWEWMTRETIIIYEPGYEEPWNYLLELTATPNDHWPSIGEMARVYARFQVLPLGACNSKAFTMATLLYRAGVLPDWIAVAHSKAHDGTQHLYLAVHLDGRWRYVDPTCIREHDSLAEAPETVGCIGADYRHPYDVIPLPGSLLTKPMLLE